MTELDLAQLIASTVRTTDNDGWFTTYDLAQQIGRSQRWVSGAIRAAVARGELIAERRLSTNVLGQAQSVPMYRKAPKRPQPQKTPQTKPTAKCRAKA